MGTGMTILIVIWVLLLLVFFLVYRKPGFQNSTAMVKLYPAGRKETEPNQDSQKTNQAA